MSLSVNSAIKNGSGLVCLLILIVGISASDALASEKLPINAELVWVEQVDKLFEVRFSLYENSEWAKPETLYQSENFLTSPAIGTDHSGAKLVIWTEQKKNKSILKLIQRSADGAWSSSSLFSDRGSENFAATIVYDLNNIAWVFWASTRGDLSDIYLAKSSGLGWSQAGTIHDSNQVPDILPVASLNRDGDVAVNWTKYSFSSESYISVEKIFSDQQRSQNQQQPLVDVVRPEQVSIPDFVPDKRLVVLHFPANSMIQSRPISLE